MASPAERRALLNDITTDAAAACVHLDDNRLRTPMGDLPLPAEVRAKLQQAGAGRDLIAGIRPEHQGQIFEKFGRVAGSAKPGTGLGLFLSRSFAEAHGGSLAVDSRPGEGSTFTLRLPATREA